MGALTLFNRDKLHAAVLGSEPTMDAARWCVAFSGGADSLALLHTVVALWPERWASLTALHFNHRLRGVESERDEVFCREVCAQLGVAIRADAWAEAHADASEADARAARQAFFKREMDALGARVLFTGHHKDDVAEMLLMRLARGSGAAGLAAPRPVQMLADGRVFLRPLLTLTKAEIIAALRASGLSWREDATNATRDFFRNRVRDSVVPAWRAAAENDALCGAALSRELLEEDDTALEAWLDALAPPAPDDEGGATVLDLRALVGKPRALVRRALRRWLHAAQLARKGFEELLAIWERGAGRMGAGEGVIEIADGVLRFVRTGAPLEPATRWSATSVPMSAGVSLFLPDGACLRAECIELTAALRGKIFAGAVDPTREVFLAVNNGAPLFHAQVRPWSPGDRYRPLGAPGAAKLQDLFVNRKIPPARRRALPVVCGEAGEIMWVPGFPPAEAGKLAEHSSQAVHLTYEIGTCTVGFQSITKNSS